MGVCVHECVSVHVCVHAACGGKGRVAGMAAASVSFRAPVLVMSFAECELTVCVCVCVCVCVVCLCVVFVSSVWAEALRQPIAAAGGVALVAAALRRHADHAGVVLAACYALANLASSGA